MPRYSWVLVAMALLVGCGNFSAGPDRVSRERPLQGTQVDNMTRDPSKAISAPGEDPVAAIGAADNLVLNLWQAVADPAAPVESLEWLAAYFRRGWSADTATALASYYSYTDGGQVYRRYTDDVLPDLQMATTVTVLDMNDREAVVEAEFPAIDGPVRYPAATRQYHLIREEDTWKVARITVMPTVTPTVVTDSGLSRPNG